MSEKPNLLALHECGCTICDTHIENLQDRIESLKKELLELRATVAELKEKLKKYERQ